MSPEVLELARRFAEAVNARRVPEELADPELRIENVSTAVTDKVYLGVEGARQWQNDLFDAFDEDARYEQEVVSAGDDYVVVSMRIVGRGSRSGAPLDLRWYGVMWVRGGKFVRAAGYPRRREALAAVGEA